MSRPSHVCSLILAAGAFLACAHLCEHPIYAQEDKAQAVSIPTVDGVKIKGHFYAGKATSPTVIMLHPVGEGKSSKVQDWKNLAASLQEAGYSVMMFDFRGHGESTSVDADVFWTVPMNRTTFGKLKSKEEIEYKDYKDATVYLPVLVNDIAAVKAYLDRMHDKGSCNTSNTIVVGADNGATLGAIWINSEWSRYRLTPPTMIGKQPTIAKKSEGADIIAAIFLTISPDLSPKRTVSVPSILNTACKTQGMGAVFFYGDKDTKAKDFAKMLESKLKVKDKKKYDFIGAVEMPNTNLSGMKLLQKSLETDVTIKKYLEGVVSERTNEYIERDALNAFYVWRLPGVLQPIPAKNKKGERNLLFNDYNAFAK